MVQRLASRRNQATTAERSSRQEVCAAFYFQILAKQRCLKTTQLPSRPFGKQIFFTASKTAPDKFGNDRANNISCFLSLPGIKYLAK
jgi:hypothetical protein